MKNKTAIISFIGATVILVVIFNACSKKERTGNLNDIGGNKTNSSAKPATVAGAGGVLDYYAFMTQPSNGVFGIKSYTTADQMLNYRATLTGGSFIDANGEAIAGGPVSIGSVAMADSGTHSYGLTSNQGTDLFGTNTTFSINPNPNGSVTGKNATLTMYAPSLINTVSTSPANKIAPGVQLKWNKDVSNPQNILIVLEYDPELAANASVAGTYPNKVTKSLAVPDNGTHAFINSDLQTFPSTSITLNVKLIRLNYAKAYSTDSTNTYLVYSYNGVDAFFPKPQIQF